MLVGFMHMYVDDKLPHTVGNVKRFILSIQSYYDFTISYQNAAHVGTVL